ncbi:unnamed protein product [Coccothraustes coccothraustes]
MGTQRSRRSRGMMRGQRSLSVPREERGAPRQQVKHEAPRTVATEGRPVSSAAAVGEAGLARVDPPVPPWRMPPANPLSAMRVKQRSPEQGVEMPHFGRFRSAWGHPPATSRQPPALPPAGRAEVPPKREPTALLLRISQLSMPTVCPREAREDAEGGETCPEPRSEPTEEN